MKKTLFLTAILGAAVCCTAFAADYTVTQDSGEIKFDNGTKQMSASTADDTITLNITQSGNGAFFQDVTAGGTATIAADIVINSLVFNNGYSRNPGITYKFTGDISGSGDFTRGVNQFGNTFLFTGDLSKYTGAITFYSKANSSPVNGLSFDASGRKDGMTVGASSITMNSGTKLSTSGDVSFSGTITSSNTAIGSGVVALAKDATLSGTTTLANGASLQVAEGATATLSGTVNAQTTNGTSTARDKSLGNGFGTADYTTVIGTGNLNTDGVTTWTLNGSAATYTADTHTLSYQGASTEYYFYTAAPLSDADGATKIVVATDNTETAFDMGNTDLGAIDLAISGSKVTVEGNDTSTGFITGKVTIGAGSTLELTGHDALGYNKGTATAAIEMQGEEGKKAVLDNKDTGNLTFTTDLTLKGHTDVKNGTIKVFGTKVTATGTDNTVGSNLSLDNALTVEVTGADDTLLLTGNISGGKTLTQTGAGTLTIKGNTIGNGVGLDNTGSGTMVLDSVTLGGRVNLYNTKNTVMTGGATATTSNGYVLVISNGSASSLTMTNGTYDMGTNHIGIAAAGTLNVAKDADLTVNNLYNSSAYLTSNGTLNIQGEGASKGSVTANGATYLTTMNNEGKATFNGAYTGTNVNLKDGSSTAFNAAATITNLTVAGDADLTIGGTATVATGAQVALNSLTMKGGSLTIGSTSHEDSVVTVKTLNVDGDSTLNANLVIAQGASVDMKGSVTLGCTVTISAGTVLNVEGDVSVAPVAIFTDVEGLTLGTTAIEKMGWYDANGILASVNGTAVTDAGQYVIGFWNGTVSVAEASVPEPATATLSLLALAALAARRRRH